MKYKEKAFLTNKRPVSRLIAKLRKMTDRLRSRRNKNIVSKSSENDASNMII